MTDRDAMLAALQDGEHYIGSAWVLAEDDWGDLRVPSIRGRIKHGEPWWAKHYNSRHPLHRLYARWTLHRGGIGMIEC